MKRTLDFFTFSLEEGISALRTLFSEMGAESVVEETSPEQYRLRGIIGGSATEATVRFRLTHDHPLGRLTAVSQLTVEVEGETDEFERRLRLKLFRGGG